MIRNFIIQLIVIALTFYILPIDIVGNNWYEKSLSILIISVIFAVLNITIKPILNILALPFNILTLGMFSIIVNMIVIYVADYILPQFQIIGVMNYFIFSVVMTIIGLIGGLFKSA